MGQADSSGLPCLLESADGNITIDSQGRRAEITEEIKVIELSYSLVIEATEELVFFGFYSPELEGFTGIGHSLEDCLYRAKWGMQEHVTILREQGQPVPPMNKDPQIIIQYEKIGR